MSQLYSDSIFWIETEKINPNPYQPRKEFDETALQDLADSIRQYGVLQPLVVTRVEIPKPDGGMSVSYELIAGERRLRASKLAGLQQVPVIIRRGEDSKMKLELAIIENLQREDLNPIDRARAFARLVDEFGLTHGQIGKKMGKSRAYVSNTLRLLQLPQDIMDALQAGKISEGHTRPLMMLTDRPMEQSTLFKEIVYKKMSVRESEHIARTIASEKARKPIKEQNPRMKTYQEQLAERLGTRVAIEEKEVGGKIVIDFFSLDDIESIVKKFKEESAQESMLDRYIADHTQSAPQEEPRIAHDFLSGMPLGSDTPVQEESETLPYTEIHQESPLGIHLADSLDAVTEAQTDPLMNVFENNTQNPSTETWYFEDQQEKVPEDTDDDLYGMNNFDFSS
ncbi:MAG: ParB/RepB/Spo0J family partition protein [Candidatus Pacebacteria bacterium]|nr:ParB/RepB/Spo0J family partition protein [Candidatus Paceibacterota bacterium]MCD8563563.1 ParB/RepB/Spo0J family partition protein [Candidatus Paceibacterota bacterium]